MCSAAAGMFSSGLNCINSYPPVIERQGFQMSNDRPSG